MAKKFFSLIHGGGLHVAPQTKIVPAKDFSTLLDAIKMLEKVKEDAKQYRKEVAAASEKIKEKAHAEGFEEGFKLWVDHLAQLEDEITRVRQETEKMIIPVALKAAKKIVGKELESSEKTVVDIVSNSLKSVAQHKKIAIYVNKKDYTTLTASKPQLAKLFEKLESLSVRERKDIEPGGCVIETEGGIINAQLENQWLILENAFIKLLKTPPPEPTEEIKETTSKRKTK